MPTLIYKKQLISGAPAVTDNIEAGNMKPVTSNAVNTALPTYIKTIVYAEFIGDYSYTIIPSQVGLSNFANCLCFVSAASWAAMADIQEIRADRILLRVWEKDNSYKDGVALAEHSQPEKIVFQAIVFNS